MHLVLFCAAIVASGLALELHLHPGGALVPEDTSAVQEARLRHEAALEAARDYNGEEDSLLSSVEERRYGFCVSCGRFPRGCINSGCRRCPRCRG